MKSVGFLSSSAEECIRCVSQSFDEEVQELEVVIDSKNERCFGWSGYEDIFYLGECELLRGVKGIWTDLGTSEKTVQLD